MERVLPIVSYVFRPSLLIFALRSRVVGRRLHSNQFSGVSKL